MRKKKSLLVFYLCMVSLLSFSQEMKKSYFIKANIIGLGNDSVYLIYNNFDKNGNRLKLDTIATKANTDHFSVQGKISSTKYVWVSLGGANSRKSFSFYMEPGQINIKGQIDALNNLNVSGTISNDENLIVRNYSEPIYKRILVLRESLKNIQDGSEEYKGIAKLMNEKNDSIRTYNLDYIKNNPNSFVSAALLYVRQDDLPIEELETLYNNLSIVVQNSNFGNTIRGKIKARKFVAIGRSAPDFTSLDTSGKPVKFSDFRGKYVLLEFWANWCVPCRAEHPNLRKVYENYKDKNFTIVQYSIDERKDSAKWKAAIVKDQLVWTELSDLNGFESKVAKLYGVQPIPDNFLISPEGKIIARGLRGGNLEKELSKILK